jgi:hypothetical protein
MARRGGRRLPAVAAAATIVLAASATGCGGSTDGDAGATTARPTLPSSTADGGSASTAVTAPERSTTGAPIEPGASTTTAPVGLADASITRHTAPAQGAGVALLRDVRLARHADFERIVFEFAGSTRPAYRIEWVDGPILADASGEEVDVAGDAYLEMVMQPASGVDMESQTVTYPGPDRIAVSGRTELITDLVRTGDFEAVLSWAAGARRRVPIRVLTLTDPTRVVVDLATGS